MTKKMKKIMVVILVIFICLFPLRVNATDMSDEKDNIVQKIQVSEIDLGDYEEQMTVGDKQLLSVTALPENAEETILVYKSSNVNVATINSMGRITALAVGNTTITVTAGKVKQSFELKVVEKEDTTIPVTDIEIADYETELEVGKTTTISGTVLPSNATDSTITYISSNVSVATVTSTGEVKGISSGDVVITLTAGGVSRTANLKVKVATTGITLNKDYLVLKRGETYQLSAKVTPEDASQTITYKSADSNVATVSEKGVVVGKKTGTTTVIVSNGDSSVAVSVIVNQSVNDKKQQQDSEETENQNIEYKDIILASEQAKIDSEMLKNLYETKTLLKIEGNGYFITIDGNDIVNYDNEFSTDISMQYEEGNISFCLNNGNELCGAVTLYLEEVSGKYLYLYNESKEKYERIECKNSEELKLTTAGTYQIRETKLKSNQYILVYMVIIGGVVLLIGMGVYILVKKKYWFW